MKSSIVRAAAVIAAAFGLAAPSRFVPPRAASVSANDNRVAAGMMHGDSLAVTLEAREGEWKPYGPTGPAVRVIAFGEAGKPTLTPGPMIRVRAGTHIHARVHNTVATTLVVHGLADRHAAKPDTLIVPPGATRDAIFTADDQGTFFYWATTTGSKFFDRMYEDAQLNGALIVDARAGAPKPDRVFVVQWYVPHHIAPDTSADVDNGFFTFNGMPWPNTERLHYAQGDSVRWRFINASADLHPLHLHGFYYRISARGDEIRDTLYWPAQQRMAVTELMSPQTTMDMAWYADRPGGWIFHCHLNFHVIRNPALGAAMLPDSIRDREVASGISARDSAAMMGMSEHDMAAMGGLMLRMDIAPSVAWHPYAGPRERLHLYVRSDSVKGDTLRRFGYSLTGPGITASDSVRWPGPPIILHVGQPASVMVVNQTPEASQVHWHGLELESLYDGVAGISSNATMVAPMIAPRDSFEMTVTPPRAGSFMYHTHINDVRQQSHGLYGPLIVLPRGAMWDPSNDLIFMAGTDPVDDPILNGGAAPAALTMHLGKSYRVRLMNLTLDAPVAEFWLSNEKGFFPLWTPIAKDGYDLPAWQREEKRARQRVSIGETYDFNVSMDLPGEYAMELRGTTGTLKARQVIHVVP